eukprot:243904-Chlamydomonas_euryale.AAC.1
MGQLPRSMEPAGAQCVGCRASHLHTSLCPATHLKAARLYTCTPCIAVPHIRWSHPAMQHFLDHDALTCSTLLLSTHTKMCSSNACTCLQCVPRAATHTDLWATCCHTHGF